jgi:hypothetical protein
MKDDGSKYNYDRMVLVRDKNHIEEIDNSSLSILTYSYELELEYECSSNSELPGIKLTDAEYNFRTILNRLVIIKNKSLIEKIHKSRLNENSDSILTYCYVDNQAGITFEYLCPFNIEKRAMFVQENKNYSYKLRFGAVTDFEMLIIESDKSGDKIIDDYIEHIQYIYQPTNDINMFRTWGFIDHLRSKEYPDDIFIGIYKEGFEGEGMYIKL